jgi:hypothetical protein
MARSALTRKILCPGCHNTSNTTSQHLFNEKKTAFRTRTSWLSKIELLLIKEFMHVRCIEDGEEVLEKDPRTKDCCSGRDVSKTFSGCEECE